MKTYIIGLLSFIALQGKSQTGIELEKYSYSLSAFRLVGNYLSTLSGTCFFMEYEKDIFLVTAKHVLAVCKDGVKRTEKFNEICIYIPNKDTTLIMNIKKTTDSIECKGKSELDLDIIAIKVPQAWHPYLYRVNDFLLPPFRTYLSVQIFGFPESSRNKGPYYNPFVTATHIEMPEKTFTFFGNKVDSLGNVIDPYYYGVVTKDELISKVGVGFSGSPVFLQDSVSKKWRNVGVLTAVESNRYSGENKAILIVSIDFVAKIIAEQNITKQSTHYQR